jgi:hypothetical protein
MPQIPIGPKIAVLLKPFLDSLDAEWIAQAEGRERLPTLPLTGNKVNVRRIVLELGLQPTQEQHFYRNGMLRAAVNNLAEKQGVQPIGSRASAVAAEAPSKTPTETERELRRQIREQEIIIRQQSAEIIRLRARLQAFDAAVAMTAVRTDSEMQTPRRN